MIHELGHFFTAKKTGVQVLEFGIGIPPKIMTLRTDKSGTAYTLNAVPLGGFVRLKGEDPSDEGTFRAKDSFVMASFRSKTIILLAGIAVNFTFARLVLTVLFWRGISPLMIVPDNSTSISTQSYLTPTNTFLLDRGFIKEENIGPATLTAVASGGLGSQLGLLSGDIILSTQLGTVNSLTLQQQLKQLIGQSFVLNIKRGSDVLSLSGACPDDNCVLGVLMNDLSTNKSGIVYRFSLGKAAVVSLQELYAQGKMTLYRLGRLGSSLLSFNTKKIQSETKYLSGPVGAVKFGDVLIQNGMWSQFRAFGALISFALAIFNLLPIPALDGGRRLGVIIQSILFPKRIEKYFTIEGYINFVVFWLLMILGIYVILKDLVVARGVSIPWIG